jgi:hypothetical protein
MTPFDLVILALAAIEFRWRMVLVRFPLVILTVLTLVFATGLGPAYRQAMTHPRRVMMPAPHPEQRELGSEYASGVQVMADAAEKDLTRVRFPIVVLVWLAFYPAVFPDRIRWQNRSARESASQAGSEIS